MYGAGDVVSVFTGRSVDKTTIYPSALKLSLRPPSFTHSSIRFCANCRDCRIERRTSLVHNTKRPPCHSGCGFSTQSTMMAQHNNRQFNTRSILMPSMLIATLIITLTLTLTPTSVLSFPDYTKAPAGSDCVWYVSRTCPNVVWPVPGKQVQTIHYDKRVADDIMAHRFYTGSRVCQRWYANFKCRSAFHYCDDSNSSFGPCRSECEELSERCPGMRLDCSAYPDAKSSCRSREQIEKEPMTPGMPNSAVNDRYVMANAGMVMILMASAALVLQRWQ